jgi:hypothetical protein
MLADLLFGPFLALPAAVSPTTASQFATAKVRLAIFRDQEVLFNHAVALRHRNISSSALTYRKRTHMNVHCRCPEVEFWVSLYLT